MYEEWLKFKKDPKNIKDAEDRKNDACYKKHNINNYLLQIFYHNKYDSCKFNKFDVNNCMLSDFPLKEQAQFINNFVLIQYEYGLDSDWVIVKLIFQLWSKYIQENTPHTKQFTGHHKTIYENLYTIKENLKAIINDSN